VGRFILFLSCILIFDMCSLSYWLMRYLPGYLLLIWHFSMSISYFS